MPRSEREGEERKRRENKKSKAINSNLLLYNFIALSLSALFFLSPSLAFLASWRFNLQVLMPSAGSSAPGGCIPGPTSSRGKSPGPSMMSVSGCNSMEHASEVDPRKLPSVSNGGAEQFPVGEQIPITRGRSKEQSHPPAPRIDPGEQNPQARPAKAPGTTGAKKPEAGCIQDERRSTPIVAPDACRDHQCGHERRAGPCASIAPRRRCGFEVETQTPMSSDSTTPGRSADELGHEGDAGSASSRTSRVDPPRART